MNSARRSAGAIVLLGLLSVHCSAGSSEETSSDGKLIGGSVARAGQYPASIQVNRGPDADGKTFTLCTAIPISRTHILLAAHCVFTYVDGVQQAFGLTMFYSYGVNAEKLVVADIKATYLPKEAEQFLIAHGSWIGRDIELAHDIAIVELRTEVPAQVAIGTMSARDISVDSRFRYGGYGCEKHASTPAEDAVTASASDRPRLKYAQGVVTQMTALTAQGPTYEGLAKQSLCPGDSGGPVYAEPASGPDDGIVTEFIGINNFHKTKASGDNLNSEINFSIVTTSSELGRWVSGVLAGAVKPHDSYED